jgi:hypothetical protein
MNIPDDENNTDLWLRYAPVLMYVVGNKQPRSSLSSNPNGSGHSMREWADKSDHGFFYTSDVVGFACFKTR